MILLCTFRACLEIVIISIDNSLYFQRVSTLLRQYLFSVKEEQDKNTQLPTFIVAWVMIDN